jgi:enoyl-CoA hydratase
MMTDQSISTAHVDVEVADGVATVTLDNPPLNLLTSQVKDELTAVFAALGDHPHIRAAVLTGRGDRAFCAGANLKEFPDRIRLQNAYEVSKQGQRMSAVIRAVPFPLIAAVDGPALGGGAELLLFTDFRLASRRSTFGFPEILRGIFPGTSGSQLLPRAVGPMQAKRLMMLGEIIDADEALNIGLLTQVTPDDPLDLALEWGSRLAQMPGQAIRMIKTLIDVGWATDLPTALELESNLFFRAFTTEDAKEGAASFLEKREPLFTHR